MFCAGATVRVTGLTNAAHLNGLAGKLGRFLPGKGRHEVDLGKPHGVKLILPANLVVPPPAGAGDFRRARGLMLMLATRQPPVVEWRWPAAYASKRSEFRAHFPVGTTSASGAHRQHWRMCPAAQPAVRRFQTRPRPC